MVKHLLVFFLVATPALVWSQQKATLNGYIRDADNGEELIGVPVYIPELKAGAVTNAYGFYSITVPQGTYEVQYSYIGYKFQSIQLDLSVDLSNNIELQSEATVIQ